MSNTMSHYFVLRWSNKICGEIGISFAMTISTYFVTFHFRFTFSLFPSALDAPLLRFRLIHPKQETRKKERKSQKYMNVCIIGISVGSHRVRYNSSERFARATSSHVRQYVARSTTWEMCVWVCVRVCVWATERHVCVRLNEHSTNGSTNVMDTDEDRWIHVFQQQHDMAMTTATATTT